VRPTGFRSTECEQERSASGQRFEPAFSVWFWRVGLAVSLLLRVTFALQHMWPYFAFSVAWIAASFTGWFRNEGQQQSA
jgi:hypothetical protein